VKNQDTEWRHVFLIPGQPLGKQRPRMTRTGHVYTPKKTVEWEMAAAWIMKNQFRSEPIDEPCVLVVVAVAARPKRLMRRKDPEHRVWCPMKPDFDNTAKIVADAMVKAGVLRDDKVVVDGRCLTVYAAKSEGPCVEVLLSSASDYPLPLSFDFQSEVNDVGDDSNDGDVAWW